MPKRQEIRGFNLPGTPWATSACRGRPLLFNYGQTVHFFDMLRFPYGKLAYALKTCHSVHQHVGIGSDNLKVILFSGRNYGFVDTGWRGET